MKLFGFTLSRSRPAIPASQTKALASDAAAWLTGREPGCGGLTLSNAYQQVVWVYRAVNVLAEQIANIPFLFSLGERGRENLVTHGPLVDFYNQPHPQINRFQYWELRIIWLMLRGECVRVPVYAAPGGGRRGGARPLERILILDPAHFRHIIEDHQLIGWQYHGFGPQTPLESQVLLPEEVWFEKLPNPFNFWRGLAPLQVAGLAAQTDFAAGAFMKGLMENNGDLGLIVRAQEQMGPEQREQLRAALRDRRRRAGSANEPLLLWNTTEIVQPQLSSSDLQFLENRKFSRAEICAAFGIPEEIVTTTDNSKYDVMEGARLNFIEHRVGPLCRRLEAGEDRVVHSFEPGAVGWFDLDSLPILQKAQRDRLAAARTVFDMGVPFNELNRVLDLGFRRLPWGDRGYVASKLNEVGREEPQRSAPAEAANSDSFHRMSDWLDRCRQTVHDPTGASSPPAVSLALSGKLRRFFFEQRGRILNRLQAMLLRGEALGSVAAIFDLADEDAKAVALVQRCTRLEPACFAKYGLDGGVGPVLQQLHETNRDIEHAIATAIDAARDHQESMVLFSARIRALYNSMPHPLHGLISRNGSDNSPASTTSVPPTP